MRGKAQATLVLEQAILEIVEERAPITVRGVCYALFVRELIPSMEVGQTQKISRIIDGMREERALDWTKIVDGSRAVKRAKTWNDPDAIIQSRRARRIVATTGRTSRSSSRCGRRRAPLRACLRQCSTSLASTSGS